MTPLGSSLAYGTVALGSTDEAVEEGCLAASLADSKPLADVGATLLGTAETRTLLVSTLLAVEATEMAEELLAGATLALLSETGMEVPAGAATLIVARTTAHKTALENFG